METKIKVGAVSYLNTKPLLYGLERLPVKEKISLSIDYPANVARQLLGHEIDLGLVPVAILPELPEYFIDSAYCIGADGPVGSVCLFSQVPVDQIETVLLDYQSRTSVVLAKVLLKYYWNQEITYVAATPGFESNIEGTTAAVVIGDRAFERHLDCNYAYDLAEAWKAFTGLPFVFAAWVANRPLPEAFIDAFDQANQYGLDRLEEVMNNLPPVNYDLNTYFTRNISYALDEQKRQGLHLFLKFLGSTNESFVPQGVLLPVK